MTQSDSERLTTGFFSQIRESPFRIAPERAIELVDEMGGETWPLDFASGSANFEALPNSKTIEGTYAALLSLWAVAASVWAIFSTARMAREAGYEQLDLMTLPAGRMAMELKRAALEIIRNPDAPWDEALPDPDPGASRSSFDGLINNLFLAAVSFVVLHEIGHLVMGHQAYSGRSHDQEREADEWAIAWILKSPPSDKHRDFRAAAICVAFVWIGLIDEVRRSKVTHPPANQRLGEAFNYFEKLGDDSLAFEISSYALKAYFDPVSENPADENPLDGFISSLMAYSRSE
ncbi:phage exclusion protein Lit family protein [Allopontixanthobacter sediminis]|uniref:Uncharacterized protein n=1 Tax=Allopontixanthobacter sediminis TaxID=1689985 RepID=A0A845AZE3_9SPHN|nr:hypothetical protein [Allopontixanthobacter sediminis]